MQALGRWLEGAAIIGPPPRSRAAGAPGTTGAVGWSLWAGPLSVGHKGLPRANGRRQGGPCRRWRRRRRCLSPSCLTAAPHPHPPAPLQDFYVACSLGGIVACGLTHTAVTPLDVVKCNMQTDPKNYTGGCREGEGGCVLRSGTPRHP